MYFNRTTKRLHCDFIWSEQRVSPVASSGPLGTIFFKTFVSHYFHTGKIFLEVINNGLGQVLALSLYGWVHHKLWISFDISTHNSVGGFLFLFFLFWCKGGGGKVWGICIFNVLLCWYVYLLVRVIYTL